MLASDTIKVRAYRVAKPLLLLIALLAGCGTPGAPLPPSLRLPRPVDDLQAVRKGDKVFLRWQEPTETTDRQGIKGETTMRLCRSYRTQNQAICNNVVAEIKSTGNVGGKPFEQVDDLTSILRNYTTQNYVIYNVEVLNGSGRSAGPSNAVTVFLAPSMPAATDVRASLTRRNAIVLQWNAPSPPTGLRNLDNRYKFKVMRALRDDGLPKTSDKNVQHAIVLAEVLAAAGPQSYEDTTFEWEKTYEYRIVGLTQVLSNDGKLLAEFEGDDSPTAEIVARDIFAPDAPQGLQAVAAGVLENNYSFIDLSWSPNQESDIAGYNVYRSADSEPSRRVNSELLKTPTFRDRAPAVAGKAYTYRVTAVDLRGNESKPSEPATETVR